MCCSSASLGLTDYSHVDIMGAWNNSVNFGGETKCGSRVFSGFGLRVSGCGFRTSDFGFRVLGFGFRFSGVGFRVSGVGFRGFEFRVSGCGAHVSDAWPGQAKVFWSASLKSSAH